MSAPRGSLTVKQENFCQSYVETGNASEAYRRAYDCSKWTDKSVWEKASTMLRNVKVQSRVDELRAALLQRHEVTVDKIIRELALIGFSNMLDYVQTQDDGTAYVDLSALTRDQAAAISEVTVESYMEGHGDEARPVKRVKFKLTDKRGALVDLGKHLGMFPTQVSGKIDHDHKHNHTVEPLSDSAQWLTRMLGGASRRSPAEPLLN